MMISVGILLPMAFHSVANAGSIFAPMHLPVILTGFICGPLYGLLVGILCPLLSFIFTGMPVAAYLPVMMVELFFYGGMSGLLFRLIRTKSLIADIYIALIIAMLTGRIMGGFTSYLLFIGGQRASYTWQMFFTAYFVTCAPAIGIQLAVIPTLVGIAKKMNFLTQSDRYLDPKHHEKQIKKQQKFFDELAAGWRERSKIDDERISELLKGIPFKEGDRVLDVACGSGVLDGWLLQQGLTVDAIDISENMIDKAKSNPQNEGVNYSISDFYEFDSDEKYDFILVFDAYPHFIDKEMFCRKAQRLLKEGGGLWIFFDEGKGKINSYHADCDEDISIGIKSAAKEVRVFKLAFDVAEITDDAENYRIGLVKKKKQAKNLKKNKGN